MLLLQKVYTFAYVENSVRFTRAVREPPSNCITADLRCTKVKTGPIVFMYRTIDSGMVHEGNSFCLGGIDFYAVPQQIVSVHNFCYNGTLLGASCYDGKTA